MRGLVAAVAALAVVVSLPATAVTAAAQPPTSVRAMAAVKPLVVKYKFKNCTALNKVYAHGVGKSGARDHTSGTPVTDFKVSTSLYKKIIKYRKSLDRDKDGIACERA
ncbi:MAG: excalibur calcium-binding domain-containing protein [Propionibacteriales bacterium]|jgi:hypothetical protein|nr:excalibur calcium-binding domain-containing protein [Propionibacteriales bacterium]